MDTRRMRRSIETVQWPPAEVAATEVEVVELQHVERPGRRILNRLLLVAGIVVLAAAAAIAGLPSRSTFALDAPLPNLFSPTNAP